MILSVSRTCHPQSHTWKTLNVPDWSLGGWGHLWHQGSLWYVILKLCAKFKLSSMIWSMSKTCHPWSHTWRILKVPDWSLGGWGHPWHHGSSWYVILEFCVKFQLSSMIWSVSRTFHPWSHTWRTLKVPDWSLGGWGHPWHHRSSWYVILELCAKFQLSSMIWSVSRTCHPRSHTSRTLKVPDWSLGGWGHPWHHWSSWYVIF